MAPTSKAQSTDASSSRPVIIKTGCDLHQECLAAAAGKAIHHGHHGIEQNDIWVYASVSS